MLHLSLSVSHLATRTVRLLCWNSPTFRFACCGHTHYHRWSFLTCSALHFLHAENAAHSSHGAKCTHAKGIQQGQDVYAMAPTYAMSSLADLCSLSGKMERKRKSCSVPFEIWLSLWQNDNHVVMDSCRYSSSKSFRNHKCCQISPFPSSRACEDCSPHTGHRCTGNTERTPDLQDHSRITKRNLSGQECNPSCSVCLITTSLSIVWFVSIVITEGS